MLSVWMTSGLTALILDMILDKQLRGLFPGEDHLGGTLKLLPELYSHVPIY